MTTLLPAIEVVSRVEPMRFTGRVEALRGLTVLARDLPVPVGSLVRIGGSSGRGAGAAETLGEVVGFDGPSTLVMMLGSCAGIRPGDRVVALHAQQTIGAGSQLLGRVIDGLGRPIDGRGPVHGLSPRALDPEPLPPMQREAVRQPMPTGVRAIDLFTTLGRGQRMGVFAGPGVGKSTLLGCIARNCASDVSVVALIGERGREVGDFVRMQLGPEGLSRSVVVACTSDEAPTLRVSACFLATAIAEFFRDQGLDVLLMMDSLTRLAMAQRQVGLAAGEPPTSKGYPSSVYALLPRLLERAGRTHTGSITGVYTVLVEGDDIGEPLADAVRGILDGHIWLSRALASRGHYPAIDVLNSISRVMDDVVDETQRQAATAVRRVLATWNDIEDLVSIGAYVRGANPDYDVAVQTREAVQAYLRQPRGAGYTLEQARTELLALGERIEKAASLARQG